MNYSKNEERLIEIVKEKDISGKEICEMLNIQRNNLPRLVNPLLENNILTRIRKGRTYVYSLIPLKEEKPIEENMPAPILEKKERSAPLHEKAYAILLEYGKISRIDLVKIHDFFDKHLTRIMRRLEAEGKVKVTKYRNRVYYRLPDEEPMTKEERKRPTELFIEQIPTLHEFLKHMKKVHKCSQATIDSYTYNILTFMRFTNKNSRYFDPKPLVNITEKTIDDFIVYMTDNKKYENSSQVAILSSLKSYFNYCCEKHYITVNPMEHTHFPTVEEKPQVDVDIGDFETMEQHTDNERNKVLLHFMLFTGMRVSEVAACDVNDIYFEKNYVDIPKSKSKRWRLIYLTNKTLEILQNYIQNIRTPIDSNETALFISKDGTRLSDDMIKYIIRETRKRAGIRKKITAHSFRRGFACLRYERGVPLLVIHKELGHKSYNTTLRYVQIKDKFVKEEALRGSERLLAEIYSIDEKIEHKINNEPEIIEMIDH